MKPVRRKTSVTFVLLGLAMAPLLERDGGAADGHFRGRIAYSADGNHNDPDDWIASPVSLAILAEAGLKDRLVHFDYNCILPLTNPQWEKIHADSVLGAAERYGFARSTFHACRKDLDAAMEIRFLDEREQRCRFAAFVKGVAHGAAWESSGEGRGWTSHTLRGVSIRRGDEIRVDADGALGRIDYVQFNPAEP